MEEENARLYEANMRIIRANEELRRKAERLTQENRALLATLRQRLLEQTTQGMSGLQLGEGSSSAPADQNNSAKPPRPEKKN